VVATAAERPQGSSATAVLSTDQNRVDCDGAFVTRSRGQDARDKSGGKVLKDWGPFLLKPTPRC
jgi:hypothetical protein